MNLQADQICNLIGAIVVTTILVLALLSDRKNKYQRRFRKELEKE